MRSHHRRSHPQISQIKKHQPQKGTEGTKKGPAKESTLVNLTVTMYSSCLKIEMYL